MATARETAFIFASDPEDAEQLKAIAEQHHLSALLFEGGIAKAAEDAGSWTIAPHYLILDLTGAEDPAALIMQIAEKGPPGETDVIAYGNRDDVGLYRELRRMGIVEYLTRPLRPDDVDDVMRQLIQHRRDESKSVDPERLVTVTATRGGAGASMVAGGIANIIATEHGRRTLLLDMDLEGGTQYVNFNVEPTPGLFDMLEMPHRIDAVFLERTLATATPRLSVLSTEKPESERQIKEDGLAALIKQAAQGIEALVIDVPRLSPFNKTALFSAGSIVIVSPPTLIGLRDTVDLMQDIERGGAARRVLIALNKVGEYSAGTLRASDFAKRLSRAVAEIPFDRRNVTQAMVRGTPVIDASPSVGRALRRLASELPSAPKMKRGFMDRLIGSPGTAARR